MTNTIIPFLRPMRLPELLDQAIRLYRRNFFKLIAIVGVVMIPIVPIQAWAQYLNAQAQTTIASGPGANPFLSSTYLAALGLIVVVGILSGILLHGWCASAIMQVIGGDISGQPVTVMQAFGAQGFSWLKLAGIRLLVGLAVFIFVIIPCIGWLIGPGLAMAFGMMVYPLMPAVFVFERPAAVQIFRRAWDLARTRFWWMIGFGLVLGLMAQLLVTGPAVLVATLIQGLASSSLDPQYQAILTSAMQSLTSTFSTMLYIPLQFCAAAVVYFDLRVRSEALDLALQAAREADPSASLISLARTSPPKQGTFITGQEVLFFILITIGVVALYFLLVGVLFAIFAAALGFSS